MLGTGLLLWLAPLALLNESHHRMNVLKTTNSTLKRIVNSLLSPLGVRLVGKKWGPRGYLATLQAIRNTGLSFGQVIDVGASNGIWSQECSTVLPHSKFFMVDPLPSNKTSLETMVRCNPRFQTKCCALGASVGNCELRIHGDQSSFLGGAFTDDASRIEVETFTMDHLFENRYFEAPDFVKLDVQGHEMEVLEGATECLQSARFLLVETHIQRSYHQSPLIHDIVGLLAERGFLVFDICTYAQRPKDFFLSQSDIFFAKPLPELFPFGWQ